MISSHLRIALFILLLCLPGTRAVADELVFGMSAAFSGPTRGLGIEYYRGVRAYLEEVNSRGGVNGHTFRIVAYDDGYNPEPCVSNTIRLVEQDKVFALLNYVGTPTTTRVLPLLKRFKDMHVYMLFPFTGAEPLRNFPYGEYVYNLRASYFNETMGLVKNLVDVGRTRVAVFYQADAYGRNGWDGVNRALHARGLEMVGEAAYSRGATFARDFTGEVDIIMGSKPDAVIMVGSYAACAAFIRDARDKGFGEPIAGVSFSDSDNMVQLLEEAGLKAKKDYTANLIFSQVVPSYEDVSLPGVRLYRELMAKNPVSPPAALMKEAYRPQHYSFVSFEGFLNGMLLVEVIRRMGDDVRPERIPEIMETIVDYDLGIGLPVTFGPESNQGLHAVNYTTVRRGHLVPLRQWEGWRK